MLHKPKCAGKFLTAISIMVLLFLFCAKAGAQGNQTVSSGSATAAANFPAGSCIYNWVNDTPGIGLPASGTGDISSFTAVNTGSTPVTATIKATPAGTGYAYITNAGANTISVINTATRTIVSTIPVDQSPRWASVSPDGKKVYVANYSSNTISVINTATNQVINTIGVGPSPISIAVSPDGSRVYVSNSDFGSSAGSVSVINTLSNLVIATIPFVYNCAELCISPDGSRLFVNVSSYVSVINTTTNTEIAEVGISYGISGITISPDGSKVYIANALNSNVAVISTSTNTIAATIPVGSGPYGINVSPDGTRVYVTNSISGGVSVINTSNNKVVATIPDSNSPGGVCVSPDGNEVYVIDYYSSDALVINTSTNTITATIPLGNSSYPNCFGNFIGPISSCNTLPVTFTITVKPSAPHSTISPGTVTGAILTCAGNASTSPEIEQFSVSGIAVTTPITATAPVGFEVSLAVSGGYGGSVTVTKNNEIVYVRSAASDAPGNISGSVVLSSTSAPSVNVIVAGVVNALPIVNQVSNQTVTNGAVTAAVSFNGTSNTFNWTNDTPGIGLPASGTGNIASFNAVNTSGKSITATITATPVNGAFAYITNSNAPEIYAVNTANNTISTMFQSLPGDAAVAISPDGTRLYTANYFSNKISVFNTANNTLIKTISGAGLVGPYGICVSPDGNRLYISNSTSTYVTVVNTTTYAIEDNIPVGNGGYPRGIAVSPDGLRAYVANDGGNYIAVINTVTQQEITTIPVGSEPFGVCMSTDGSKLYVANKGDNLVAVINTATNVVSAFISVGSGPYAIAVSPDDSRIYVTNRGDNTVSVINTAINQVIATPSVGKFPYGISVTPDNKQVYVVNSTSANVSVIDAITNLVTATISLPIGTSPDPFGNFIAPGPTCPGDPITFTITVKPSIPQGTISPGAVTGSIAACAGNASASPDVEQFSVSGTNVTTPITATAPAGFEVSLSAGSGYGGSVTITKNNQVVYVCSAAVDAPGGISGNVVLSSTSAPSVNVAVTGVVNALPMVNQVSDQSVTNGTATQPVNFTGTQGDSFAWTNDTPGIGLPVSGTGNIASFNAMNTGNTSVTATVTVTPVPPEYAYIPNSESNNVSVINTATKGVVATIGVGKGPVGVVVSPDGTRVYITNSSAGTVSVINAFTNQVISTIIVGANPAGIAISPDGSQVYVANQGSVNISVISTAANMVSATIDMTGNDASDICVSQDGKWIYCAAQGENAIVIINTATNTIASKITIGGVNGVEYMTTSPVGNRVYVTGRSNNNLLVINSITNVLIATIPLGSYSDGVTVSPDGSRVYVTSLNDVFVINTTTDAVITTIPVDGAPSGVSVSPDGSSVYVTSQISGNVTVISTATNTITNTISAGQNPITIGNFITTANGCPGQPITFTITVKPGNLQGIISAGIITGSISACVGNASASPNIEQFSVSGTNVTTPVTATAPTGFEVSLSAGNGYGSSVTFTQNNQVIYVRSAAADAADDISGNVVLSSTSAPSVNVAVTGVVNALPMVNAVSPQIISNGSTTQPVNFTGTGNTFTWTNDTPGIGLPASGTGNITSFNAVNTGNTTITATVTVTPAGTAGPAYIPNSASKTVSVINTATQTVVATIPVGAEPLGVAISPDGTRIYVTNYNNNSTGTVSIINAITNQVISTVTVGVDPDGIAISPDGNYVYVANEGSQTVSVISTVTNTVSATINLSGYDDLDVSVSQDGKWVYVTVPKQNTIIIVNAATNSIASKINVGSGGVVTVCTSPTGNRVYVTGGSNNDLLIFNSINNVLIANVLLGGYADEIAVSPDGSHVYVTSPAANEVYVVNTVSNAVVATIPVTSSSGISVSPDGSSIYVISGDKVIVISTATNAIVNTISVGQNPQSIGNFIAKINSCPGQPITFTITVKPTPPVITATTVRGNINVCEGTASASPNILQFSVSGITLVGDIVTTVPPGFEVSGSFDGPYGNNFTFVKQPNGTVNNVAIYIRAEASAPVGNLSGNIVLSSTNAAPVSVPVTAVINDTPTADQVSNQSVVNGTATVGINFTGTGNTFTWVNNTPGIGLPASGAGNISPFKAVNTGTTPITATITATPINAGYAYVTNVESNDVSVVNTASNTVIATIPAGQSPEGESLTPDGSRVYVTNYSANTVSVISTASKMVIATIGVGTKPYGVVVSPDGSTVYVSNYNSNTISVISTATNTVSSTINVGKGPLGICISPDGSNVYTANYFDATVSIINTATSAVSTMPAGDLYPWGIVISPDGSKVYVTTTHTGAVSAIYTQSHSLVGTPIPVGQNPFGMALSADGITLYIANGSSNTISVINTINYSVSTTIKVGNNPNGLSLSADGSKLYAANFSSNTVSVINTATNAIDATVAAGTGPNAFGNFVTTAESCAGTPMTFTITVKPSVTTTGITASAVSGNIALCVGMASASPDFEQFTVSGGSLSANITATAPSGFTVSLSPNGPFSSSVTLTATGGTVSSTVIYVGAADFNTPGHIGGNITLTSAGTAGQSVAVSGIVNALPTANPISNQEVVTGQAIQPVNFTGTADIFNWVNDTPTIGLPASGSGNIPAFVAVNNGSTPVIAKVSIQPVSTGFAYVPSQLDANVSVINTTTNAVVATIAVGETPTGVTVSPDGSTVYISNQAAETISVINTATNKVTATINTPGFSPTGMAVSPDGSKLYVVNLNSYTLSIFNTATNTIITTIKVGSYPLGVVVSPDGKTAYVSNSSNSISVIDATKNLIENTIQVGKGPYGIALSPDGSKLYVAVSGDNDVTVINTFTNATAIIPVGSTPLGVCVSPDGSRVYATNQFSNNVSVINAATNSVMETVNVGLNPAGISISSDGGTVYVANLYSGTVSVINTSTNTAVSTILVSPDPLSLGNFVSSGTGCDGIPMAFTITVDPAATSPIITVTGIPAVLTTVYGTPSASTSFNMEGGDLTTGILVTAPPGFEVSADNTSFSGSITIGGAGNVASTTVYVRLAAITAVGMYSNSVILTSKGATTVDVNLTGTVTPAPLTITADNKTRFFGADNPILTVTYTGFVNKDDVLKLTMPPNITTTAIIASPIGGYPITASGAVGVNYKFTYIPGVLTITIPAPSIAIPNTFTPNGDGINDTWDIKNLQDYPNCTVNIYNRYGENLYSSIGYPIPWNGTYKGVNLPVGVYYYIINLKNGVNAIAGWVAIIR